MELTRFSVLFAKYKKLKFIIHLLCVVLTAGLTIYTAYFTGQFIDRLLYSNNTRFLFSYGLIFIFISMTRIVTTFISSFLQVELHNDLSFNEYQKIIQHIHRVPLLILEKYDSMYLKRKCLITRRVLTL